jgi:hypothetical protein
MITRSSILRRWVLSGALAALVIGPAVLRPPRYRA